MLPDRVSNPGPLTFESGALPIALRGPAQYVTEAHQVKYKCVHKFLFATVSPLSFDMLFRS